jgi:hypothetical protein
VYCAREDTSRIWRPQRFSVPRGQAVGENPYAEDYTEAHRCILVTYLRVTLVVSECYLRDSYCYCLLLVNDKE